MTTLSERKQQFRELTRLFAGRFLENDLICVDGDTRGTLIGVLSLLIAPGVFLPLLEYLQFGSYPLGYMAWQARDAVAVPHKLLHIALSMTVLGLFTVFEWDAMLPDRRDMAVLRPFPVGLGTMFAAKVSALFLFWAIFTLAVDAISDVFFSAAVVQNAPDSVFLRCIAAHGAALVAANLFVFLAMIGVQGLLMTALGPARFRRFAPYAQFALIAGILTLFFFCIGFAFGMRTDSPPSPLIRALPAYWFLGLDQVLVGLPQPLFEALAAYVAPAILLAAAIAACAYSFSYRRSVHGVFEAQEHVAAQPGRVARWAERIVNERLLSSPGERAAFLFVWHTLMRSRSHRLLVAAWTASGAALVLQGITGALATGHSDWWRLTAGPLLPVPIVLPLFLVTGLRYAFTVPAELRANWVFQQGCGTPAEYLAGARAAALALAMTPFALLLPVFTMIWGWRTGGLHVLIGAVVAWLLLEAQMAGLEKLPFTCSYVPGKANVRSWWTLYIGAYLIYTGVLCWVDLKILQEPSRVVWFLAAAWGVHFAIRRYPSENLPLTFDERPAPAVLTLELRG
ncbi:MAG TPA: hypothetical protein VGF49_13960 [Candidatus Solibacter sp.]